MDYNYADNKYMYNKTSYLGAMNVKFIFEINSFKF